MKIDHIVIPVADLDGSAQAIEQQLGVSSVVGGRHASWGTAMRIVPLGEAYLELVAVVNSAAASATAFGRWIANTPTERPRPTGWAVRVDDIEGRARRLGLTVTPGSRARPDGRTIRWRTAGVEVAALEPFLPFFIQWSDETDLPGRTPVTHAIGPVRLARLEIDGDPSRLATWLGDHRLPIEVRPGDAAVGHVVLEHRGGEIVL
jgi:hypothetical protein